MTTHQTWVVTFVGIVFTGLVLEMIRRQMLRARYAMVWFLICACTLSVPWLYDLYTAVGRAMGILRPNSFFFYAAIMLLLLLSLQASLALTAAHTQRKHLIQRVALLEARIRDLEREDAAGTGPVLVRERDEPRIDEASDRPTPRRNVGGIG